MNKEYIKLAITSMVLGVILYTPAKVAFDSGDLVVASILSFTMLVINIISFFEYKRIRKKHE